MKLVKEHIEFDRGQDPKRSMGLGKFYEIWKKDHLNEPILSIYFRLKDQDLKEYVYVVDLIYGKEEDWTKNSTEDRDAIWFEEGLYKAKGNRLRKDPIASKSSWNWFPMEEEKTSWQKSDIFNKQIIDKLEKNPEEVFAKLAEDWFETTPSEIGESLIQGLEKEFKRGFSLERIDYEYHS
jgi:hypothetical protein